MWEVDVRLLRLDATEGGDLRHLGGDRQDGVGAIAKRVVEQTAMGEGQVSRGVDRKAGTGAGAHLSEVTALPLSAALELPLSANMLCGVSK